MTVDGGGSDSEAGTGDLAPDQKIRDSCNACSSHKIRCTKERPACRRCASKSLQCEYSVSRRNGKRRRSDAPGGTSGPGTTPIMSSAFALDDLDQLCDMTFGAPILPPNISDESWMSAGTTVEGEEPRVGIPVQEMGEDHDTAFPHSQPADGFAARPELFEQSSDFRGGEQVPLRGTCRPSRFYNHQSARSTTVSALHGRGEDCTTRALGVVMRMHIAPKMCSAPDHSLLMHAGGTQQKYRSSAARDIDTVLHINREAISTLNSILDCSTCSSDHMCILTCFVAAQKTVAWYAAVLGIDSGIGHGNAELADLVSARPIYMGSFALGREAQRLVHASVILAEVRDHVQPLVARLAMEGRSLSLPGSSPTITASATSCSEIARSSVCKLHDQIASILARASPPQG